MNCKDIANLLGGYVDEELDLVRSLEIERHLEDCASCLQTYKALQALRTALKEGALYAQAPAHLQKRIQVAARQIGKTRAPFRALPWQRLSLAAALACVLLLTWSLVRAPSYPSAEDLLVQEVLSSHVRSLMPNHLADIPSSNKHAVKPWFNGKVDFSPTVVDLAKEGFPLIGGRLDYLDNRSVAALVYQHNQHIINLFIWPSGHNAPRSEAAIKSVSRQGYHLSHWTKSGMTYWAISDLNTEEFNAFAKKIRVE